MKSKNWLVSLKDEKDKSLVQKFKTWFTQQVTDFDGYFVFDRKYHGMKINEAIATDISAGFDVISVEDWNENVYKKEWIEVLNQ